jgi:iron(III) transport system permease protein
MISFFKRHSESFVLVVSVIVVIAAVVVPLAGLGLNVGQSGVSEFGRALKTLSSPQIWDLLLTSLRISILITTLSMLVGVVTAIFFAKAEVTGAKFAFLLHAFPMFLPPFLLGLGWFHLLGRQGVLGSDFTARILFGEIGVFLVLTIACAPIVTSLVTLGLRNIDPAIEEAARLVARPWRVILQILLPAAWPAIVLPSLIIFALAVSELGVPMFLRVRVYPAVVFSRLGGFTYSPGEALTLVAPLFLLALGILGVERWILGNRSVATLGYRKQQGPAILSGGWKIFATIWCWLLAVLSVLPLASLMIRAYVADGFSEVPNWIGNSLWNSLLQSSIAATAIAAVGVVVGHAYARGRQGSVALDGLSVLAFVTPAAVIGVGLIAAWNRPSTQFLYSSMAIIVLGFLGRYLILGVRTIAGTVSQTSAAFEDAGAAFGAGYLRRLLGIVVPMHVRGIIAAWLLAMIFCLRDLETAILVYPAGREPLTVRIFTLEANGPEGVVAALALVHVTMTAIVLMAGLAFLAWRNSR